jgi:hypothetical protein
MLIAAADLLMNVGFKQKTLPAMKAEERMVSDLQPLHELLLACYCAVLLLPAAVPYMTKCHKAGKFSYIVRSHQMIAFWMPGCTCLEQTKPPGACLTADLLLHCLLVVDYYNNGFKLRKQSCSADSSVESSNELWWAAAGFHSLVVQQKQ